MSFRFADPSLLDVPGIMSMDELAFLAALARRVPQGGRIVEVGCFYGRSTNAMARANPGAQITSIDKFENLDWTERYSSEFRGIPPFGLEAFESYTRDCANVTAIKGMSPDVVADWNEPIDMYFEDAVHGNPGLRRNLDFWFAHLRPGGVAAGHDYNLRFPDVKSEVDAWAARWNIPLRIVGSLWALRKPVPGEDPAITRSSATPSLSLQPMLYLRGANRKAGAFRAADGYWAGAHLEADRLNWLSISAREPKTCPALEYRVGHREHGNSDWVPMGTEAKLVISGKQRPFTRLAVRHAGGRKPDGAGHIIYRVSARGRHQDSGMSNWASDGAWARLSGEKASVSSYTVTFADTIPVHHLSSFSRYPMAALKVTGEKIKRRILKT